MTNQSPTFQIRAALGIQPMAFPPIGFYDPITFTSPELSARMANKLKSSRLNDCELTKQDKHSLGHRSRNALSNARTQQPSAIAGARNANKLYQSVEVKALEELQTTKGSHLTNFSLQNVNKTNPVIKDGHGLRGSVNTNTIKQMFYTAKDSLDPFLMSTDARNENLNLTKQLNETETFCSVDLTGLRQTATNWLMNSTQATGFFTQAQSMTSPSLKIDKQNSAESQHRSILKKTTIKDGKRTSVLSGDSLEKPMNFIEESLAGGSFLMATRVPYKGVQSFGDHNLKNEGFVEGDKEEISNFSLGHHFPMSPAARQKHTLNQIQRTCMKVRGKLMPGQPTAKEHADKIRREQAISLPQDYGENTAFVHNSTAKPITAYKLNKFKALHQMTGAALLLDREEQNRNLSRRMQNKKSLLKSDLLRQNIERRKVLQMKEQKVSLYTSEDLAMIKNNQAQTSPKLDTLNDSQTEDESCDEATPTPFIPVVRLSQVQRTFQQAMHTRNIKISKHHREYDLYMGAKGQTEFNTMLSKQIKNNKPDINISDIANQYYNPEIINGSFVQSNNQIFKKTLNKERKILFELDKKKKPFTKPTRVFGMTGETALQAIKSSSFRQKFQEEKKHPEQAKVFTLNQYTLSNLEEAYKAYFEARKIILQAAKKSKQFKERLAGAEIHITEQDIVKEIRKNPELEKISKIIEDPHTHALIRLLITYEKYNLETEQQCLDKILESPNTPQHRQGNLKAQPEVTINEIELMQELVMEFGSAIKKRMKIRDASAPEPGSPSQNSNSHIEPLSGQTLRQHVKNKQYQVIDRFITSHPEFQKIKDEAKKKVIQRFKKHLEAKKSGSQVTSQVSMFEGGKNTFSPSASYIELGVISPDSSPGLSKLRGDSSMGSFTTRVKNLNTAGLQAEPATPSNNFYEVQRKRKLRAPRSKLAIAQFVQSNQFQECFKEMIEDLDSHFMYRRDQNKLASKFINEQVFYKLTKESITNNTAENPNINYMKDCESKKVIPYPIYSKIRNNMLKLLGYQLNEAYCEAIGNYLYQQLAEEALIETLVLHNNNCSDKGLASILKGITANTRLINFHYSQNELGPHSNREILNELKKPFPQTLKSICLSNLNTRGKAALQETNYQGESNSQERPKIMKNNIVQELTTNLLHTENLHRLVLQDIPLNGISQQNLVAFVAQNSKLENLQLINCQMHPENLIKICVELEPMQWLQNLSFAKNILRNHSKVMEFSEALTKLIQSAVCLIHLDISGMYIGNDGIRAIMCDGVANSNTLAGVHFQDNRVSHQLKIQILYALVPNSDDSVKKSFADEEKNSDKLLNGTESTLKKSFKTNVSLAQPQKLTSETSLAQALDEKQLEQRDNDILVSQRSRDNRLDKVLDSGQLDQELLVQNINEMFKANMSVISFPQSQNIINAGAIKLIQHNNNTLLDEETLKYGIQEDLQGTLYVRISTKPQLYSDKAERENYFKECAWQSVSFQRGCWICNSTKIVQKVSRAFQTKFVNLNAPQVIIPNQRNQILTQK